MKNRVPPENHNPGSIFFSLFASNELVDENLQAILPPRPPPPLGKVEEPSLIEHLFCLFSHNSIAPTALSRGGGRHPYTKRERESERTDRMLSLILRPRNLHFFAFLFFSMCVCVCSDRVGVQSHHHFCVKFFLQKGSFFYSLNVDTFVWSRCCAIISTWIFFPLLFMSF